MEKRNPTNEMVEENNCSDTFTTVHKTDIDNKKTLRTDESDADQDDGGSGKNANNEVKDQETKDSKPNPDKVS